MPKDALIQGFGRAPEPVDINGAGHTSLMKDVLLGV
jgi:hypothetical protein